MYSTRLVNQMLHNINLCIETRTQPIFVKDNFDDKEEV